MTAEVHVDRFKFTLDHYHRMIETGVFGPNDKLELIEGELLTMGPSQPAHAHVIARLTRVLVQCTALDVRVHSPIILPEHSEPEPDFALVLPKDYSERHPQAEEIALLIEVSASSINKDRQIKLPLYARYQIPEVWIADVPEQTIELYWGPSGGKYTYSSQITEGQLTSPNWPEITVELDRLWRSQ